MKPKELLYFVKSDRSVLLIALSAIFVILLMLYLFGDGYDTVAKTASTNKFYSRRRALQTKYYHQDIERTTYYNVGGSQAELFTFDPNTADSTQLLRLGLQPWQVRSIYKYRAKGGVFRSPADFARLYGLTRKQFIAMEPYIRISSDYSPAAGLFPKQAVAYETNADTIRYTAKIKSGERVAINIADTSELKTIPGIGAYFARQIVYYRERLGGFYDANQLLEIENFPTDALKYVSLAGGVIHKLNVNKLTLSQLHRHPYINFYQAREIVDYRRLKGELRSLDDLRLLKDFPPAEIKRLEPYVEF